jgi:phage repressor protein C with HTH and peptisase S24 domain
MNDLSNDGTYVVSIDDKLYVKLLQRIPGNKVQVVSKNQEYSPFTVDLETEHFRIIGKVIWSGGKKDRY